MKRAALVTSVFLLNGCATHFSLPVITPEQRAQNLQRWQSANCNYDQGYELGNTDGLNRVRMNGQGTAAYCPNQTRSNFMRGYRDGYASANRTGDTTVIVIPAAQKF